MVKKNSIMQSCTAIEGKHIFAQYKHNILAFVYSIACHMWASCIRLETNT